MKNQPRQTNGRFKQYKPEKPKETANFLLPEKPTDSLDYSQNYHKIFSDFPSELVKGTDKLIRCRPSMLSIEEKHLVFERWIRESSEAYEITTPQLYWGDIADAAGGGFYDSKKNIIVMSPTRASIITLMHEFRHALQAAGVSGTISEDKEIDARAWSLSLYYQVRPLLLKKLVLEGKVFHIAKTAFEE